MHPEQQQVYVLHIRHVFLSAESFLCAERAWAEGMNLRGLGGKAHSHAKRRFAKAAKFVEQLQSTDSSNHSATLTFTISLYGAWIRANLAMESEQWSDAWALFNRSTRLSSVAERAGVFAVYCEHQMRRQGITAPLVIKEEEHPDMTEAITESLQKNLQVITLELPRFDSLPIVRMVAPPTLQDHSFWRELRRPSRQTLKAMQTDSERFYFWAFDRCIRAMRALGRGSPGRALKHARMARKFAPQQEKIWLLVGIAKRQGRFPGSVAVPRIPPLPDLVEDSLCTAPALPASSPTAPASSLFGSILSSLWGRSKQHQK